jgi:hypothetical protein
MTKKTSKDYSRVIPVIAEIKPPIRKYRTGRKRTQKNNDKLRTEILKILNVANTHSVVKEPKPKTKSETTADYRTKIDELWEKWMDIHNNGNKKDGVNTDGFNLELIHNEIKNCIEKLEKNSEYVGDLSLPPNVDPNYIANPNTIRKDARKALNIYKKDENLQFLLHVFGLSKKEKEKVGYNEVVNYYHELEKAIATDDLITMRHKSRTAAYLFRFKEVAAEVRKMGKTLQQKTLF